MNNGGHVTSTKLTRRRPDLGHTTAADWTLEATPGADAPRPARFSNNSGDVPRSCRSPKSAGSDHSDAQEAGEGDRGSASEADRTASDRRNGQVEIDNPRQPCCSSGKWPAVQARYTRKLWARRSSRAVLHASYRDGGRLALKNAPPWLHETGTFCHLLERNLGLANVSTS